jgi:hypothetical protein
MISIIQDSGDIPLVISDVAQGINGSIAYVFKGYTRSITLQCHSQTDRDSLLNGIASNNGLYTIDSVNYLVKSISLVEHFLGDQGDAWTYSLELYRDDYSV